MNLCEMVEKAKKIRRVSNPPRRVQRGDMHTHRVEGKWGGFVASGHVIPMIHQGRLELFTVVERVLLDLYMAERALGGDSKIEWAWRASLYVVYCEPCETLFWMHQLPDHMPLWPVAYFPNDTVFRQLETMYPRDFLLGLK